jgi:hypothetical protein
MDGKQADAAVNRAAIVFFFNCKLKSAKYFRVPCAEPAALRHSEAGKT